MRPGTGTVRSPYSRGLQGANQGPVVMVPGVGLVSVNGYGPTISTSGASQGDLLHEDFSLYTNTSDLLTGTRAAATRYLGEAKNTSAITLDTTKSASLSGIGTSTKSMLYTPPAANLGCDYAIIPGFFKLGPANGQPFAALQWYVIFGGDFTTDQSNPGCGAPEYKFGLAGDYHSAGATDRWNIFEMQTDQWVFNYPGGPLIKITSSTTPSAPNPITLWDGVTAHRFRAVMKADASGSTGIFKFWFNNTKLVDLSGFSTASVNQHNVEVFRAGANFNQGSRNTMHLWWLMIDAWSTDQGWG